MSERVSRPGRKLLPENFVLRAIVALRQKPHKGIHVVYSGLIRAMKAYYGEDIDPRETIDGLIRDGVVLSRPVKGGIIIYCPDDAPKSISSTGNLPLEDLVSKILD